MADALPRVYEPDEKQVHYVPPDGLDQVTMCGLTDWIGATQGWETSEPLTCRSCAAFAAHFQRYLHKPK